MKWKTPLTVAIILIACLAVYAFLSNTPPATGKKPRYDIVTDGLIDTYADASFHAHATVFTNNSFQGFGWDTDGDNVIDEQASVINDPVTWHFVIKEYPPWQSNQTKYEKRYALFIRLPEVGEHHIRFLLNGTDGWHNKSILVRTYPAQLRFSLAPEKVVYSVGENITLNGTLANDGVYPIRIYKPDILTGCVEVEIATPGGYNVSRKGPFVSLPPETVTVGPASNTTNRINLSSKYIYLANESHGIDQYKFNETGIYHATAKYIFEHTTLYFELTFRVE